MKKFYHYVLEFPVIKEWNRGNVDRGVMFDTGGVILELLSTGRKYKPVAGCALSLEVSDVRKLWDIMKNNKNIIFAIRGNAWGDTSFGIKDPEGFELTFFTKHNDHKSNQKPLRMRDGLQSGPEGN